MIRIASHQPGVIATCVLVVFVDVNELLATCAPFWAADVAYSKGVETVPGMLKAHFKGKVHVWQLLKTSLLTWCIPSYA